MGTSCLCILLRPAAPMQVQWHEALLTKKAIWLNTGCETCAGKDYSQLCPAGWQEMQDGACKAPAEYTGFCKHQQTFLLETAVEKEEAELSCGVCWPCTSA